jgi:hypothetical protein
MKTSTLILTLLQLLTLPTWAQVASTAQESVQPIQAEIYLDNPNAVIDERWESSPSSPPMATDDPGTPGRHGFETSVISNCDRSSGHVACDNGIDLPIGIGDTVQLRFSKSVTSDTVSGEPTARGYGATDVGVKWRFHDKNGLQIAVFPSYKFDDATKQMNPDGTPVESDGRSIYLPLIVSKDIGQRYTVVANVGYRSNFDYPEKSSVFTSAALGRSLSPSSRAMVEVASEATRDDRRTDVRIGWVKVLFPKKSGRYQTSFFTSLGRSVGKTDDGKVHTTVLFGLNVTKKAD